MNRREHLLACLAEECDEVGQRVMKALRFGLKDTEVGADVNNAQRIAREYADLVAVYRICIDEGILPKPDLNVRAKRAKIERYMEIAIREGALTTTTTENKQ